MYCQNQIAIEGRRPLALPLASNLWATSGGAYETHALGFGFGVCDFSFRAAAAADRPTLHNASDIPAGQGA